MQQPLEKKQDSFYDFTRTDLEVYLKSQGKEKYRSKQLFQWVYDKKIFDFKEMTNFSKVFREELPHLLSLEKLEIVSHLVSTDGTRKFLFKLSNGDTIESVLIPSEDRRTLCVSSEVGCNMACKFCFTGKQKLKKRLTAGEIVLQFLQVSENLPPEERITNVVFMGMGEPLDNPEAVFKSIEILHDQSGFNFSKKRITVSTSGLVPQIDLVADSGARLAVSLNATTNDMRDEIMPINKKYPLEELLKACHKYHHKTGEQITFEYVLLKDVNDTLDDAKRIAKLTRGIPSKINLIPFNEHPDSGFSRPESQTVSLFQKELMKMGLHVLVRRTMGRDIYAACGQLRSKFDNHPIRMEGNHVFSISNR